MVNLLLLAGGYGTSIVTYLFNSTASTLSIQSTSQTGTNPSWITQHQANDSIIYAVNDINDAFGNIQSFTLKTDGSLSPAGIVSSNGINPAHAAHVLSGNVAVMNYNSGNGKIIPTYSDGLQFGNSAQVITFPVESGQVSHPHQVVQYGDELFVPDLALDKIWRIGRQDNKFTIHGSISQPKGSGPRHVAFADGRIFILNELSNTLTMQPVPSFPNGTVPFTSNISTLPSSVPANSTWAAAEILIPPLTRKFPTRYIYVSNRNIGPSLDPRGDAIAIFKVNGNRLELVNQVYTGLNQPRGMELGQVQNGGDEYLAAAGVQGNGGVVIFKRTQGGRNLVEVARNTDVTQRSSFVWV